MPPYTVQKSNFSKAREFKITDAIYADFLGYIKDKDYDYTTESEKALEEFKAKAVKENYFEAIKADYESLKAKQKHDKEMDVQKHSDEIKSYMEQEIASRYYYQQGRTRASFRSDPELKEALSVLSDDNRYKQILKLN